MVSIWSMWDYKPVTLNEIYECQLTEPWTVDPGDSRGQLLPYTNRNKDHNNSIMIQSISRLSSWRVNVKIIRFATLKVYTLYFNMTCFYKFFVNHRDIVIMHIRRLSKIFIRPLFSYLNVSDQYRFRWHVTWRFWSVCRRRFCCFNNSVNWESCQ